MKRTLAWYAERARAFDLAVFEWNDRELARHEREIDSRVDEDYEAWLEQIEPEEA